MDNGHVIATNQSTVVTTPPRPQAHGYPRAMTAQPEYPVQQPMQGGYHPGYQQQQQPYHGQVPPQQFYGSAPSAPYGSTPSAPLSEEPQYPQPGTSGYGGMNTQPGPYYGEPPPPYSEADLPPAKPPVKS